MSKSRYRPDGGYFDLRKAIGDAFEERSITLPTLEYSTIDALGDQDVKCLAFQIIEHVDGLFRVTLFHHEGPALATHFDLTDPTFVIYKAVKHYIDTYYTQALPYFIDEAQERV